MESNFADRWMRKFRVITISLIFSGALNIGLIAAFIAFLMKDQERSYSFSVPRASEKVQIVKNDDLLASYARLSFRELCSILTNCDMVEEGFTKRDLALAALVAFYDFNIEQALSNAPVQKRKLQLDSSREIELFAGLSDDQYQAILRYAYLERWPLTSRGLLSALQKGGRPHDESLVQALMVTKEFYALQTLFQKSAVAVPNDLLIDLMGDGTWTMLDGFLKEQSQMLDLSEDRRQHLLVSYLALQSSAAADLLLQTDFGFSLKRLDDKGILTLVDRARGSENLRKFCVDLLQSARCDAVHEKAARILYKLSNEEMPQPFDYAQALVRFVPRAPKKSVAATVKGDGPKTYVVKEGDSLWKIARQYHVKLDDLIRLNKLDKDRLKVGMELKIPGASPSKESGHGRPDGKGGSGKSAARPAKGP